MKLVLSWMLNDNVAQDQDCTSGHGLKTEDVNRSVSDGKGGCLMHWDEIKYYLWHSK